MAHGGTVALEAGADLRQGQAEADMGQVHRELAGESDPALAAPGPQRPGGQAHRAADGGFDQPRRRAPPYHVWPLGNQNVHDMFHCGHRLPEFNRDA
ncbi:hypothetical protein BOS5A_230815 [Bosea sp. EC-HK365B]|nr:hypothetical protein BOSE7B_50602 [Bosea sp. 7B]CAD5298785.1 hypothetical protein BOSE21B_90892 [Bosea sp. 21B]VVT61538.1 hypothetical protein BOS5A_230815 [Bosea sp. EC-HK365B]VXB11164.1 hypothetical protein BOSE127_100272 [Bosea sp. 127]